MKSKINLILDLARECIEEGKNDEHWDSVVLEALVMIEHKASNASEHLDLDTSSTIKSFKAVKG